MTLDLNALAAVVAAMTPGEWKADIDQFDDEEGAVACVTDPKIAMLFRAAIDAGWPGAKESQELRDATAIATLRNGAAELIRLARVGQAYVARQRAACTCHGKPTPCAQVAAIAALDAAYRAATKEPA